MSAAEDETRSVETRPFETRSVETPADGTLLFGTLAVGDTVAEATYPLTRDSLVRYAGASGDFNPIHYRDEVAASVGLPGVLAHGMLTMGLAVQPVAEWAGDPARVVDYQVRFTRPVVVEPSTGASITVLATVGQLDAVAHVARIDLTVTAGEQTVLGKAQVRVTFSAGSDGAGSDHAGSDHAHSDGAGDGS